MINLGIGNWIREQIQPEIVVRSMPPNLKRLLQRCRFTAAFIVAELLFFLLLRSGVSSAAFVLEITTFAVFSFGVEYLAGTSIAAFVTLVPLLLFNSLVLLEPLAGTQPYLASFGAIGTLNLFIRNRILLNSLAVCIVVLEGVLTTRYIPLSNLLGFFTALALAHWRLNRTTLDSKYD